MLKERSSSSSTYDPYDCALQLRRVLEKSNVAPIMAIVIFDFLSKVQLKEISADPSMYEYIMESFNEKISFTFEMSQAEISKRSRAYLVLLIEIISHAKLVRGINVDLQPVCDLSESDVSVALDPKKFRIMKRGDDFVKNVESIKSKSLKNRELVDALAKMTLDEIDYIISRYESEDGYESGDVIIIDNIQA